MPVRTLTLQLVSGPDLRGCGPFDACIPPGFKLGSSKDAWHKQPAGPLFLTAVHDSIPRFHPTTLHRASTGSRARRRGTKNWLGRRQRLRTLASAPSGSRPPRTRCRRRCAQMLPSSSSDEVPSCRLAAVRFPPASDSVPESSPDACAGCANADVHSSPCARCWLPCRLSPG